MTTKLDNRAAGRKALNCHRCGAHTGVSIPAEDAVTVTLCEGCLLKLDIVPLSLDQYQQLAALGGPMPEEIAHCEDCGSMPDLIVEGCHRCEGNDHPAHSFTLPAKDPTGRSFMAWLCRGCWQDMDDHELLGYTVDLIKQARSG